jgi:hypothetical protein
VTLSRRLRFYAGNSLRALTIPWRQHTLHADDCRSIFGASFGRDGWHHLRKTLEEYDANSRADYRDTSLFAYLTGFCPSSICDLVDWPPDEPRFPLFVYPWGTFRSGETRSSKTPATSRFCGPSSAEFVADEFARTIRLYHAMRETGYRPWGFGHTFIGGTVLQRANGERRFVVLQGNHRLAVLAHLGVDPIRVRDVPGYLRVVREQDAGKWPLVADGTCRLASALRIFHFYFESTGHHIAARLAPALSRQAVS